MDSQATGSSPNPLKPSSEDRLDSWKEIAGYFRREVRTVQRWEKTAKLPVHRLQIEKQGSVYAYKSELDAWYKDRQPTLEPDSQVSAGKQSRIWFEILHRHPWIVGAVIVLIVLVSGATYFAFKGSHLRTYSAPIKTKLAVLPFVNLSGDLQQDYFSDGMTEEMITQLGRLEPQRLGVIARTSVMPYKGTKKGTSQICKDLDVNYVMEGSVRREENRARITAQLIQCADQTHVWADSADRDMANILGLEADVARAIARQIQITLSAQEQTRLFATRSVNPEAYESYLKGRYCWYRRDPHEFPKSVAYFRTAIEKQPDYAPAYSALAMSYAMLGVIPYDALPSREAMPQAKSAAEKALELDESLAEAHTVLGLVKYNYEWNWRGAEEQYNQALAIQPNYVQAHLWRAWLLLALNRHQEALEQIQHAEEAAQESDPRSLVVIRAVLAQALYYARQYDKSIAECQKAIQLDPNWFLIYFHLARAHEQRGMYTEAITELQKARSSFPNVLLFEMELGHAYALAGRNSDALKQLQELNELAKIRYVPAIYIATIWAGLGDKDEALRWLDQAAADHSDGLAFISVDPAADPLRSEPRFADLVRHIGLPQ